MPGPTNARTRAHSSENTARLLITCPDSRGIIAAVAGFIRDHGGNILDADQHSDPDRGEFFMRVEIDLEGFDLDDESFEAAWRPLADRMRMQSWIYWGNVTKRMAILVTRESHCLSDLLWRWQTGELRVEIPLVISNHEHLRPAVAPFGIEYRHLPVTPESRTEQEAQIHRHLTDAAVDFVVLARYMQVLSRDFTAAYANRIINIHHSFLPAFSGPRPYHQAYQRGVKLIGATSHYVTERLDDGPIIAQATAPVDHRDRLQDLVRKGRDLERIVLAEAVRLHIEDRILVNGNKTVVFD
jgi:formyltetrahydrofolate deformylase